MIKWMVSSQDPMLRMPESELLECTFNIPFYFKQFLREGHESATGHHPFWKTSSGIRIEMIGDCLIFGITKISLDADNYPMTASFQGVPALVECKSLGENSGYAIVYQRTGGVRFIVNSRH